MEILQETRLQLGKVQTISPTRDEPYSDYSAMEMTLANGPVMTLHESGCEHVGQCSGFNITSTQTNAKSGMTCTHSSQLPASFQRTLWHVLPLPVTATTPSYHLRKRQRF